MIKNGQKWSEMDKNRPKIDQKSSKNGQKCLKMAKTDVLYFAKSTTLLKIVRFGQKWSKNDQKWPKIGQNGQKWSTIVRNGQK